MSAEKIVIKLLPMPVSIYVAMGYGMIKEIDSDS